MLGQHLRQWRCSRLALFSSMWSMGGWTYNKPSAKILVTCNFCDKLICMRHTIGIGAAMIIRSMIRSVRASAAVAPLVSSQYCRSCFTPVHAAAG